MFDFEATHSNFLPAMLGVLGGKQATYSPAGGGGSTACLIILDEGRDLYPDGMELQASEPITRISSQNSEVSPAKGGTFTIGSTVYTIDAVDDDDRFMTVSIVRKTT